MSDRKPLTFLERVASGGVDPAADRSRILPFRRDPGFGGHGLGPMRKSLAALGLLFVLGLLGLSFANKPPATLPPTIDFVGFLPPDDEGNGETRRASFTVTNSCPRAISVARFQVDLFTNGGWEMHSKFVSGVLSKSSPNPKTHLFLEPGARETLIVDCPEGRRWRIGAIYSSENFGILAGVARIRLAYRIRDWDVLQNPTFRSFGGSTTLQSEAVPAGPE